MESNENNTVGVIRSEESKQHFYYVAWHGRSENGLAVVGSTYITRQNPISSFADIQELHIFLRELNDGLDIIITNYIEVDSGEMLKEV